MPHIYSYFEHIVGANAFLAHVALASFLLLTFAFLAKAALSKAADARLPDQKLTIRNAAELIVENLRNFVESTIGHEHGRAFVPFFGALFLYIFFNNLLGVIPGFGSATSVTTTNFSIAALVFLLTHYFGFRTHGIGYVKHFMGPVWILAPLILPIELISHLVRPASLTLRLYGNMTGDHVVLSIFTDLTKVIIPVIFVGLGCFISFVQALVFTMLSMVYIGGAMEHEH